MPPGPSELIWSASGAFAWSGRTRVPTGPLSPDWSGPEGSSDVGAAEMVTGPDAAPDPAYAASPAKLTVTDCAPADGATFTSRLAVATPLASVVAVARERPSLNVTGLPASFVVPALSVALTLMCDRYVAVGGAVTFEIVVAGSGGASAAFCAARL